MNKEQFRKAKFGFINRDKKQIGCQDRNFNVEAVIVETVPFIKKGTKVKIIGRDLETDLLLFFLPSIGFRKVHHSKISLI